MKWHSGDELPKKEGWYVRDYRNLNGKYEFPDFAADYFDSGFWYVYENNTKTDEYEMNGAYYTELPWAKIKDYE